jgi:hypothetical protein
MALPVDTTGEGADCSAEEYKEMVDSMMAAKAAAADLLALGEEVPDFGGTSSVHSSPPDIAMAATDANLKAISIGSPALGSASAGLAGPTEELRLPQATLPIGTRWADVSVQDEDDIANPDAVHVSTASVPPSVIQRKASESSGPAASEVSESSGPEK